MKRLLSVSPVLSVLATAYLLPLKRPILSLPTLRKRMAIPLPAPVPCSASFSPNKARSHRPTRVKISCPCQTSLPNDLSKLIIQDSIPMAELGWEGFVNHLRDRGNLDSLLVVPHPSHCLICQYKHQCAPIVLAGGIWTEEDRQCALK